MNSLVHISVSFLCAALLLASPVYAVESDDKPHHDLVFGLGDANKPFFENGVFMLGNRNIKVEPGDLPKSEMVSYDAMAGKIIVTNDTAVAEADKGAALLQLMDTLSIETIEPAAGH